LQITLKVHSTLTKFFGNNTFKVDVDRQSDIVYYLRSMHPRFMNYLRVQLDNGAEESYVFLDRDLNIMNLDELQIRKAREGDVLHIVPAIIGGGGKRGGILAILAIAVIGFATFGGGLALAGGAAASSGAAATGGILSGIKAAFAGLSTTMQSLVINVGLSLVTSLFMKTPKSSAGEATRENDMYGGLTNSTTSGTSVPLHYGLVRVAGQFVSGYIQSTVHDKNATIRVGDSF